MLNRQLEAAAALRQERLRQKQTELLEQGVGPQELLKIYGGSKGDGAESGSPNSSKDSDSATPASTSSYPDVVDEVSKRFNTTREETEEMLAAHGF